MATPAVVLKPGTMLNTPGGNPASWTNSASLKMVKGVTSEGLIIAQFPVAKAGAYFH